MCSSNGAGGQVAPSSRCLPEVRSTVRAARLRAVVPGAGLFVALGTSTCLRSGEANARRKVWFLVFVYPLVYFLSLFAHVFGALNDNDVPMRTACLTLARCQSDHSDSVVSTHAAKCCPVPLLSTCSRRCVPDVSLEIEISTYGGANKGAAAAARSR